MNSNKLLDLAVSISGHANLKASKPRRNRIAAMVARPRARWSAASRAAALLLGTISGPAFAQNWIQEVPENSPSARVSSGMVNVGATGQLVLFGGIGPDSSGIAQLSDTWSWNGADWTRELPVDSPPARFHHAMAYDAAHGKVVLFGGDGPTGFLSDTWEWDGANWAKETPSISPPGRIGAAMKYDAARGQVVLFGGEGTNGSYLSDTWLWNGKDWTQAEPGTSPSARYDAAMAYDAADDKVVLFGGFTPTAALNDTWVWDGSNWIQQNPPTSPLGRGSTGMAYDSAESKVVLFGGYEANGLVLNDTWEWDGTNWTQMSPTDFPAPRGGQAMAPDPQGNVVMFGGYNNTEYFSDTWVWAKGPQAILEPATLSFGKQAAKTSSATKQITLTNSGVSTLNIHSIAFTGSDPNDFKESNNCDGSLKPGFSCTIDVTFKPTVKGARSAKLVIKDNGQNGAQSATLSGTGD